MQTFLDPYRFGVHAKRLRAQKTRHATHDMIVDALLQLRPGPRPINVRDEYRRKVREQLTSPFKKNHLELLAEMKAIRSESYWESMANRGAKQDAFFRQRSDLILQSKNVSQSRDRWSILKRRSSDLGLTGKLGSRYRSIPDKKAHDEKSTSDINTPSPRSRSESSKTSSEKEKDTSPSDGGGLRTKISSAIHSGVEGVLHKVGQYKEIGRPYRLRHLTHVGKDFRWHVKDGIERELLLKEKLGEGAYSCVYRAVHPNAGFELAVKKITPLSTNDGVSQLSAINREMNILRELKHPNIVSYYGCVNDSEGCFWILMDFCSCGSIIDLLDDICFQPNEVQIAFMLHSTLQALQYLHERDITHCDMKSGNILLTAAATIKVADFGLSQFTSSTNPSQICQMTEEDQEKKPLHQRLVGSPYWMAPEVTYGTTPTPMSDIWSLGITAIEIAETDPPHFDIDNRFELCKLIKAIQGEPSPNLTFSCWSDGFRDFVSCCCAKNPTDRHTAEQLLKHPWLVKKISEFKEKDPQFNPLSILVKKYYYLKKGKISAIQKQQKMFSKKRGLQKKQQEEKEKIRKKNEIPALEVIRNIPQDSKDDKYKKEKYKKTNQSQSDRRIGSIQEEPSIDYDYSDGTSSFTEAKLTLKHQHHYESDDSDYTTEEDIRSSTPSKTPTSLKPITSFSRKQRSRRRVTPTPTPETPSSTPESRSTSFTSVSSSGPGTPDNNQSLFIPERVHRTPKEPGDSYRRRSGSAPAILDPIFSKSPKKINTSHKSVSTTPPHSINSELDKQTQSDTNYSCSVIKTIVRPLQQVPTPYDPKYLDPSYFQIF